MFKFLSNNLILRRGNFGNHHWECTLFYRPLSYPKRYLIKDEYEINKHIHLSVFQLVARMTTPIKAWVNKSNIDNIRITETKNLCQSAAKLLKK